MVKEELGRFMWKRTGRRGGGIGFENLELKAAVPFT